MLFTTRWYHICGIEVVSVQSSVGRYQKPSKKFVTIWLYKQHTTVLCRGCILVRWMAFFVYNVCFSKKKGSQKLLQHIQYKDTVVWGILAVEKQILLFSWSSKFPLKNILVLRSKSHLNSHLSKMKENNLLLSMRLRY